MRPREIVRVVDAEETPAALAPLTAEFTRF